MTTQKKIDQTWKYCVEMFGLDRCIALCLHGSQNYELDLPDSDVDAKLIIAPAWDEIINCREPKSQTIKGLYGDINVTDVRLFIGVNLKKQNFNFLETLFTPYSCVNPSYADLWSKLIAIREKVAHMYPSKAIRTMMGQVENQYGRWGRFDKCKTLYHMMRIVSAIRTYLNKQPFADTLIPEHKEEIMKVRYGNMSETEMDTLFKALYDEVHWLVENRPYTGVSFPETCSLMLDELQKQFVYRALYEGGIE
jgi:predicted nucleotidyltransferase